MSEDMSKELLEDLFGKNNSILVNELSKLMGLTDPLEGGD